jgi:internalin A
MRVFAGNLSRQIRTRVFISYGSADREWVDRLQACLAPHVQDAERDIWDDSAIPEGESWNERIHDALQTTKVAVLLVTPNFLASEFIMNTELPHFMQAQKTEGLIILWVPVEASDFSGTPLAALQAASNPAAPLAGMEPGDQHRALEKIARKVKLALS